VAGDKEKEDTNLMSILQDFDLSSSGNPEEALRHLLLVFPFLPIDAGEGADRVIKAVARLYLESHVEQFAHMRADMHRREHQHNDAVSVIYILLYAVIMLNTDLHHPAIRHKMKVDEFVASAKRTVVVEVLSDEELRHMYHSIARSPLRICTSKEQVRREGLLNFNLPSHVLKREVSEVSTARVQGGRARRPSQPRRRRRQHQALPMRGSFWLREARQSPPMK